MEQNSLTWNLMGRLKAALVAAEGGREFGMLLSIDTTIDLYGFFFRKDAYDWSRLAEVVGRAFATDPNLLTAGDMKQTNTMLQFALNCT